MSSSARKWTWTLLRLAVTALFLAWIIRLIQFEDTWLVREGPEGRFRPRPDVTEVRREGIETVLVLATGGTECVPSDRVIKSEGFFSLFERTDKVLFFAMSAGFLAPFTILSLRWWLLLRRHGFGASFGRIFFVNYAGIFFNYFLPGGVGGDVTKSVLAASGEERKAAVVGTVLLDRLIGLAVLILLGAACLAPFAGRFQDRRVVYLVYGLVGAAVLGYLVYFNPWVRRGIGARLPFRKTLGELDGVFRSARERKGLTLAVAGLSACSQILSIALIFGLAWAMGIRSVPFWQYFVFEPIIFIVTALPISIGGWGVQEWIYKELFGTIGGLETNQAIALSVLVKISQILVSIPGGLLFALGASRRQTGIIGGA